MDPGPSFYIWIKSTAIIYFLHFLQVTFIIHTIQLILCYQQAGEIENLTVTLGQSFLVVLCAGAGSSPTGSITLVSFWGKTCCYTHHTFLLGSPNGCVICTYQALFLAPLLGTWEVLLEALVFPSTPRHQTFSGAVAGDLKAHLLRDLNSCNNTFSGTVDEHFFWRHTHQAAARGVSHFQPFYFVIVA